MLLYLSYLEGFREQLHITPQRLRSLRHRLSQHTLNEEYVIEMLTKLGCELVRPRVMLPCIVQDKNGRKYDEYTYVKLFFTPELAAKYNADYAAIIREANEHHSINRPLFKHLLHSRRAWIILDNMLLDSVWAYDPFELTYSKDKIVQIRSMLRGTIPTSDNPLDILTYHRPAPHLIHPET